MKKFSVKKYIIAIFIACNISVSAQAFFFPPDVVLPMTPSVDPITDILFVMNTAQTSVQNVTAQFSAYTQQLNQMAKAQFSKYVGKFTGFMGGIFKKKEKQALPGTREIKDSKLIDVTDPAAVQSLMYTLFFQYPVDCKDIKDGMDKAIICKEYDKMRTEFYQDTIMELYAAAREMEGAFEALEKSVADIEEALQKGSDGAEDPNDQNGLWKNAYSTYETMNSVLKIIEEIQAMRAQYAAAQAIGSGVVYPALPKKEDKDAFNDISSPFSPKIKMASSVVKNAQTVAFADEATATKSVRRSITFEEPESALKDPFAGSGEDMALLAKISEAYYILQEAIEVHNQTKGLEAVRHAFDSYDKAKKAHEKSLEALKNSEKCAINYYGAMYSNPQQMWNGGLSDRELTDPDARKGISGWAVKAYNLAKAADSEVVIDEKDFNQVDVDSSSINGEDLNDIEGKSSLITKDSGGFASEKKKAQTEESMKESGRLPWNIGSEAARMLAQDQAANGQQGKWGTAKKLYPVWNDTKSYYNQYLEGKYDNVAKQLETVNTTKIVLKVAAELNSLVTSATERSNNSGGLSKLQSRLENEKIPAITNYETIVAEKKAKLNELYAAKEKKLKELDRQKAEIDSKMTSIQKQIDTLNVRRQDLIEEKKAAEITVDTMEKLVNSLYKRELSTPDVEVIKTRTIEYQKDLDTGVILQQSYNLIKGFYSDNVLIANAQLAEISLKQNNEALLVEENDKKGLSAKKENIKTYTQTEEEAETVEFEESSTLLLAQHTLSENRQKILNADSQIITLNNQVDQLTGEKAALKAKMDQLEPEKEKINEQYVIDANNLTASYDSKIAAAENSYLSAIKELNSRDLGSYYRAHFSIPTMIDEDTPYLFSLPEILSEASRVVAEARDAAQEMVRDTIKQMYAMEDDLYKANNYEKVLAIHKNLMEKLKNLSASDLRAFGEGISKYASYSGVMNALSTMYRDFIINDACIQDYCLVGDSEYFVSLSGKRRDFRAPKSVPQITLASVREIIYFDDTDYDAIPKSKSGIVTKEDLLRNMTYVPEIWKMLLTSPAYVEKDIDLAAVLQPSEEMFVNGGRYPCWYDDNLIMSEGDNYVVYHIKKSKDLEAKEEQDIYNKAKGESYMQCLGIDVKRKGNYFTVTNVAEDISGSAKEKSFLEFKVPQRHSELGFLFTYDGGLRYAPKAEKVFSRLSNNNKNASSSGEQKDILYSFASLDRNQIGEFLKSLDFEQSARQNLEELKISIDEAKQSLNETFAKIGFTPSSDFNLAKDSDYNLARNTLLRYRNKLISSASSAVSSVQGNDNEVIKERLAKINNQIKALKKDSEAYTNMGELSADNAELDETIKSEKANREVASRQKGKSDTDFEKQLKRMGDVYCAEMSGNI